VKKSEGQISLSAENVVWPGTIKIEGDDFSGECDYISPAVTCLNWPAASTWYQLSFLDATGYQYY